MMFLNFKKEELEIYLAIYKSDANTHLSIL